MATAVAAKVAAAEKHVQEKQIYQSPTLKQNQQKYGRERKPRKKHQENDAFSYYLGVLDKKTNQVIGIGEHDAGVQQIKKMLAKKQSQMKFGLNLAS